MHSAPRTDQLLPLLLRSLRDREALCALVLATYRVELMILLQRMAAGDHEDGDALLVHAIAGRIAEAAAAGRRDALVTEALALERWAAAADSGGEREQGEMLSTALRLIDLILEDGRPHGIARDAPARAARN